MARSRGRSRGHALARGRAAVVLATLATVGALAAGCAPAASRTLSTPSRSRVIYVVASENFWGSIAAQLGGAHASVYSLVSDPNADPHEFETTARASRAVAEANYVIRNGAGYDDWLAKLLAASPNPDRHVLDIGVMLGKRAGDNPHLWYNPAYVTAAENRIEADFKRLDPADAGYFTARRAASDAAFTLMRAQLAQIKSQHAGAPIAATESIASYLARYLGLNVITPPGFMAAVSQGNQPSAASIAIFTRQLQTHQARVLIYNEQTATALTTSMRELAMRNHIPVVGFTETIQPPDQTFQRWFGGQLAALDRALSAGGRR